MNSCQERKLPKTAGFVLAGDAAVDLEVAKDATGKEQSPHPHFQPTCQVVKLLVSAVLNLQKTILSPSRCPEIGDWEQFLEDRLGLVLVGLPRLVGVDVQIEQSKSVFARGEVGDLACFDMPLDMLGAVDIGDYITPRLEFPTIAGVG